MMKTKLQLEILAQPDQLTCGPTCLHAVYRYFGDPISLSQVVEEIPQLEDGGTLAVVMACHALRRGFNAPIYPYTAHVSAPSWFNPGPPPLTDRLDAQRKAAGSTRLRLACSEYLDFLQLGGTL